GLATGDQVIIDGTLRLAPGSPVKAAPYVEKAGPTAPGAVGAATGTKGGANASAPPASATLTSMRFATGSASLDEATLKTIQALVDGYKAKSGVLVVTG